MVLYVIGLGLGDHKDITIKGLECIKNCDKLYLEYYTSILGINVKQLSEYYNKEIILADRNLVESEAETIYNDALNNNIGLLVVGDPLCATTHTDIILRAKLLNIKVEIIHNTSVLGAIASCGLQLYRFGYTVSIPFFEKNWKPNSFYHRIAYNNNGGMHTCLLLDIKVKEPDYNSMLIGKLKYLPPRFMTINQAIEQLLEIEEEKKLGITSLSTLAVGMARLGQQNQLILFGTLEELRYIDFGEPLHCMAIICKDNNNPIIENMDPIIGLHPIEKDYLNFFSIANNKDKIKYITNNNNNNENSHIENEYENN